MTAMADIPGAHPPGKVPGEAVGGGEALAPVPADSGLPGTAEAGEAPAAPRDTGGGDAVVGFTLEMRFPSSWRGAYEHIGDTFFPMLDVDNKVFDHVTRADPEDEGVGALHVSRFETWTLFKRETLVDHGDSRVTMETDYEIEGDGAGAGEVVREHGLLLTRAHLAAMQDGADPRLQVSLHARFRGDVGGEAVCHLLRAPGRDLPLLVLADVPSYPAGFFGWAGPDLGKWVIVAMLDAAAADRLAESVGKEWSCPGGDARIYPTGWSETDSPDGHPAWQRREILPDGHDEVFARQAFRRAVIREVFVAPRERDLARIAEIESRSAGLQARRDDQDARMARIGAETAEARVEIDALRAEKARLEQDSRDLRSRLDEFREKRTVQRAVEWVADALGDELVIGEKVREGVGGLNPDAGPPDRVFHYLVRLGEFAREMRSGGTVDDTVVRWFQERGCQVSRESRRTQEEYPRDFPVNGETHRFDWHMKPNRLAGADGVRIHFKWDPGSGKVLVGWIGPHLRTVSYGTQ